ncbi:MAG: hypothetical protein IPM36_06430 [Lewinellaceae bacterium]|nr:hypothetical protein [Lewinellaceae bacterium]
MHKKTYIPVLWLWMAALLLSTVGISVQQLYCYCLGETAVSVFLDAEDPCEAFISEATADTCCAALVGTCCEREKSLQAEPAPCCPQKSVQVFLLKSEFTVAQPWQKTFDCPLWADELPGFLRLYQPVICATAPAHTINANLPPPLSGRQICLRHERLLC